MPDSEQEISAVAVGVEVQLQICIGRRLRMELALISKKQAAQLRSQITKIIGKERREVG